VVVTSASGAVMRSPEGRRRRSHVSAGRPQAIPSVGYDAELWLVHRHPDGTETVQQQSMHIGMVEQTFTFPAVPVQTSRGEITLDFSGKVQAVFGPLPADPQAASPSRLTYTYYLLSGSGNVMLAPDKTVRLSVSNARRSRSAVTPPLDTRGGSYFFIDIPMPSDVVSFEFPALQKATEDLLKGHTFSLRIRVTPVQK
jgi:hypothetical protein